jgi:hypothetical protein
MDGAGAGAMPWGRATYEKMDPEVSVVTVRDFFAFVTCYAGPEKGVLKLTVLVKNLDKSCNYMR